MAFEDKDLLLTIFTPTYNRAHLLGRLFDSIRAQITPEMPMEWLVIDDGSTDDTPAVLADFQKMRPDLVRFLSVANGGKYRALNRSAELARGKWQMVVDSDDYLLPGAVAEVMTAIENGIPEEIGMISCLLEIEGTTQKNFTVQKNPCKYEEWIGQQKQFDFTPIIRADLARMFLYPEVDGEKYMAVSWRYFKISKTHSIYFLNKILVRAKYLPTGISANSLSHRIRSPVCATIFYSIEYRARISWARSGRAAINYWRFLFHARRAKKEVPALDNPSIGWAMAGAALFVSDIIRSK